MSLNQLLLVVLTAYLVSADNDSVTSGTELVFTLLTHRHGDRTPVVASFAVTGGTIPEDLQKLIDPWGYGQLTDLGKKTGYNTGKFIRKRYNELLSPVYNKSEVYIRSTDSTRTKMTALSAMAAVYPAVGETWSRNINWVPVPYTTLPAQYDFNLASLNCPKYKAAYTALMLSPTTRMSRFSEVLERLSKILNFNIAQMPALTYVVYDLYVSQRNLGYDLGEEIERLMPGLEEATGEALNIIYGDDIYVALQAGVLLNEFFIYAKQVMNGTDTPRVRWFSAHDFNVFSLQAVAQVLPQGYPKYGSLFSLELRRVKRTGEYVVLPVYLPSPDEQEVYLTINGCETLCSFDKYYEIASKYLLDEATWRAHCGWTPDYSVDTSSID